MTQKLCRIYAGPPGDEQVLIEFMLPEDSNAYYTIVDYDEESHRPVQGEHIPISIREDQRVLIVPKHAHIDMQWME